MLLETQHPHNKNIMISLLGAPNAGKSSLANALMGMELSIVTHKPQTTRNHFQCVFTIDHTEVILVDTPGIHKSSKEFNKRLNDQAKEGAEGVDLNFILIDLTYSLIDQFQNLKENFSGELSRSWVIYTKSDLVENAANLPLKEITEKAKEYFPTIEKHFFISAKTGENVHVLTGAICDAAESGPHLFPGGEISNKNERFFVTEYIREQAFELLKDELPYEMAVVIDQYKDFRDKEVEGIVSHISASILVNRPSQRAIVVGTQGSMIKEIGIRARKKIESLVGGQIHLNLHVKVQPKWHSNNFILEQIGLPRTMTSQRVWRKK